MSEYIEIESESTDVPQVMLVHTNLVLAIDDLESYASVEAMAEGSAVAQALASVEGINAMRIETHNLLVEVDLNTPWHVIEAEIIAALKDFFL